MLKQWNTTRCLLAFVLAGLLVSLSLSVTRHQVEEQNKQTEIMMEYEALVKLADENGQPVESVLAQFRQAGVTSLAVYETTLEKLAHKGLVTPIAGSDLYHASRAGRLVDPYWQKMLNEGRVNNNHVYVSGEDSRLFQELEQDLKLRLGETRVTRLADAPRPTLDVAETAENLLPLHLGMLTDEMQTVVNSGFWLMARPSNFVAVNEEQVRATFKRIEAAANGKVSGVLFSGVETLGFPDQLNVTAEELNRLGWTLGMTEHPLQLQFDKQDGLLDLAKKVNYRSARLYVIDKNEQKKMEVKEALQRWAVTDEERNIRINFLRPFERPTPGETTLETALNYVKSTRESLEERHFVMGPAGVFKSYFPARALLILPLFGAAAAMVLYLHLLYSLTRKQALALMLAGGAVLTAPVLAGGGLLMRQLAALASACVIPALTMNYMLTRWEKREVTGGSLFRICRDGVGELGLAVLLSLAGGVYISGILADVRFLLEMDIYRGVKLTFMLPILLVLLLYLKRYNVLHETLPGGLWRQMKEMLNYPVKIVTLGGFGVLALVAWVFIGRSGHTAGVPVPAIELKLRAFLEQVMYARPREKEFMIGHPAFFLAVMAVYRQWPRAVHMLFVLGATIGQGSLVQTFAHMRTPVFMSFARAWDGYAAALPFGIAAVVGMQALVYLSRLLGRRLAQDE